MPLTTATAQTLGARLCDLAGCLEDADARARLEALSRRTETAPFQLVVVGEIKKGKSSFINALLGHPKLLPALSDIATSTVYQVGWGESLAYRVHFAPPDPRAPEAPPEPPRVIQPDEVAQYGTEDGNPDNRLGVDYIAVELPHPLLRQGLRIVDTPGLGGLFKSHAEILWRYAPEADAVFFVFDSVEAVASRPEMEALERLRRMTPLLFFVQTKTDLAPNEQWREWRDRNLDILTDTLRVSTDTLRLRYFPLSARIKEKADQRQSDELLQDSGYATLLRFLREELMVLKEARQALPIIAALASEAGLLDERGTQHLQALAAQTREDLHTLDRDALAERDTFRQWKESSYRQIKGEFDNKARDLKREHENDLQDRLDPGATGPIVGSLMAELRAARVDANDLAEALDELRSQVIDRCARDMSDVHDSYRRRMETLIAATTERMGASLPIALDAGTVALKSGRVGVPVEVPEHLWQDRVLPMFRGAAVGSALTGYALLGIGIVFTTVAAPIAIPALIGSMIAGIFFSRDAINDKNRERVLANLEKALVENVKNAQRQATQQFKALADRFEYAASSAFDQVLQIRGASLEHRIAQIELTRRQTQEEKDALRATVEQHLVRLADLRGELDRFQHAARERLAGAASGG